MYMKYSKIETNTSWQFCFSKMHIVESEWLFETLNSSQPLALGCDHYPREGDGDDGISIQSQGVPKKRNGVTPWPLY